MKKVTLAIVTALATVAAGSVQAVPITPAVEYTATSTLTDGRAFTLGYLFSLSAPVTINALGYWDDGLSNNHQVGIWDSSGILVTSTTVLGTDSLVGHFRWDSIGNVTLSAGQYTIGGQYLGNSDPFPDQATGLITIPQYSWVTDEQIQGAGLNMPTTSTGGTYGQNGILLVDFSIGSATSVPEPATIALFGAGLAGLGAMRRRRKAKA